jgi:DNA repair exonuclease SbcCD ATPase subunit
MATINAKVVQDYELKFQQSGLSDVNKLVANLVKSIVFVNDMAEKGVDLKVGVSQDTINNISDINKDMATLIEKTEDFNKAPTPEKYKEILDLTAKMEEKIRNVIKLSLEQGTIFKDNGKDIELLTKKLSDFQDELTKSRDRATELNEELKKAKTEKTQSDDSMKKELKAAGFKEEDLEDLSTTDGAKAKLDSMKPGANNTYTKRQEKQRELLQKIIEENKIYEKKIKDINLELAIEKSKIKEINQDINQTTKEIAEQESAWSGIFNGLLEIEEQIRQNSEEAKELIANFKKIKEEFPKTIQSLASKAGIDPTSVDTMDKAKSTLKQREGAGKKFGQSDAEYKEEIGYLRQIVDAHKEYQDSLEETEEAMKKNERQLKKNKKEYEAQIKIFEKTLQKAVDSGSIDPERAQVVRDLINTLKALSQTTFHETKQSLDNLEESLENVGEEQKKVGAQMEEGKKGFIGAAIAATVYYAAIRTLRKLVSEIINTVKELDKSLTEVAMVTNLNREEA